MKKYKLVFISVVSVLVSACGGSSGTDTPAPLVTTDTTELKNNAATAIGGDFDGNLTAVGQMLNQNRSVFLDTSDVVGADVGMTVPDAPTEPVVQNNVQSLVLASLSASEGSQGVTTRSGNTITIDPDENELCNDETLFGDDDDVFGGDSFTDFERQQELDYCLALAKDLTVQLIASGEESGEVSYLFQNQAVLTLGYAPGNESVELDLGGLKILDDAASRLMSEDEQSMSDNPLSVVTGSLKMATVTSNDKVGQEAGSVSLEVVKPINIVAANSGVEESISMNPGTLFAVAADTATGEGSLSFDVGAIAAVFDDDAGLGRFNLAGFTGKADVNPTDGSLVVSNLGLSRGPLSASIDNQEVLKMTLQSFGFRVSEQSDQIIIDGDMDLSLLLDSMGGFGLEDTEVAAVVMQLMAPSGTAFSRAGNGAVQIGGSGPFTVTIGATNTQGDFEESVVTVNAGECVDSFTPDAEDVPSADKCL